MSVVSAVPPAQLDRGVAAIESAVEEEGPLERRRLEELVGTRFWGPGVFSRALREAVVAGDVERLSRRRFGPPTSAD